MKAVRMTAVKQPLQMQDIPIPNLGEDDVLAPETFLEDLHIAHVSLR